MYEKFTDRARKVLQLANQEALRLNHESVDTGHVLMGICKEGSGMACTVLRDLGVEPSALRESVSCHMTPGPDMVKMQKLPQTPSVKLALAVAIEEAKALGHNYVGTEHVLLGLLCVRNCQAALALAEKNVGVDAVRLGVKHLLQRKGQPDKREEESVYENFPFKSRERRYRVLSVTPELLMNALFSSRRDGSTIRVIRMEGLPDGCEIQAVTWDDLSCCFKFRLWHESFDVVPAGEMCPAIWPLCHAETLPVVEEGELMMERLARAEPGGQVGKLFGIPVIMDGEPEADEPKQAERRGYEFL